VTQLAGQGDPVVSAVLVDALLEHRFERAFAHDHQLQAGYSPLGDDSLVDEVILPLDGGQPPHRHDGGQRCSFAAGVEHVVDPVVDRHHSRRLEAEVQQLVASRIAGRERERAPVEGWRQPGLHRAAHERERPRQQLVPHRSVHVVQERDARLVAPHRAQPRHAVPDLHQRVVLVPGPQLASDTAREHAVAAALAHHVVPVAIRVGGQALRERGAVRDLQPGGRPAAHEVVGVHLRAAGVVVVEVSPGQHVYTPTANRDHLRGQLLDARFGSSARRRLVRHGGERVPNLDRRPCDRTFAQ